MLILNDTHACKVEKQAFGRRKQAFHMWNSVTNDAFTMPAAVFCRTTGWSTEPHTGLHVGIMALITLDLSCVLNLLPLPIASALAQRLNTSDALTRFTVISIQLKGAQPPQKDLVAYNIGGAANLRG